MSEPSLERRDIQTLVSDMRVDVAQIKTRVELQTGSLARLEAKLDLGVFREEYERRHEELSKEVAEGKRESKITRDDYMRRQGANRIWRWLYGAAIAVLGLAEVWFHH